MSKSLNYGSVARILREQKPAPSVDEREYEIRLEQWLDTVDSFVRECEQRELQGFNPRVFRYKAGAE